MAVRVVLVLCKNVTCQVYAINHIVAYCHTLASLLQGTRTTRLCLSGRVVYEGDRENKNGREYLKER